MYSSYVGAVKEVRPHKLTHTPVATDATDHSLFRHGAADTSSTVMARTEQVLVAVYRCCCAMALLQLAPSIAGMAVTAAGDGSGQQQLQRPVTSGGPVADDGVAARAARNKRWSTTFGANTSNKNNTGERDSVVYAI